MLATVLFPELFRNPRATEDPYYYRLVIGVLKEALDSGVILTDTEDRMICAIQSNLKDWPQGPRSDAQRCLVELRSRHRLIGWPARLKRQTGDDQACKMAENIARFASPDIVLQPAACMCNQSRYCFGSGFSLDEVSSLRDAYAEEHSALPPFEWKKKEGIEAINEIEEAVLRRIFRWSNKLTIVDRFVGEKAFENSSGTSVQNYSVAAPGFSVGLAWLVDRFAEYSIAPQVSVEIITQFPIERAFGNRGLLQEKEILDGLASLDAFRLGLANPKTRAALLWAPVFTKSDRAVQVSIEIWGSRSRNRSIGHDRFLVTRQSRYNVGRGVDLLNVDARKNLVIGRHQAGVYQADFNRWPEDRAEFGRELDLLKVLS